MDTTAPRILFVDDEATAVKYFQRAIGTLAPVIAASSVDEGMQLLEAHAETLAVLVSDQRMPGRFGNELLRHARDRYPHMVRILTTAYSEIEHTVEAINEGQIHRYIKKPWEISALRMELRQALEFASLRIERDALMRDKLLVQQRHLVGQRIGMLGLLTPALPQTLRDAYLGAALTALWGKPLPCAPDWGRIDHADLCEGEAMRALLLRDALAAAKAQLPLAFGAAQTPAEIAAQLVAAMGEALRCDDEVLHFTDAALTMEFVCGPPCVEVSAVHARWLAALAALDDAGWTLRDGRLQRNAVQESSVPLAAWIEHFQQSGQPA